MGSLVNLSGFNYFLFRLEVFYQHFSINVFEIALYIFLVSDEGRYGLARLDAFGAFSERRAGTQNLIIIGRDVFSVIMLWRDVLFVGVLIGRINDFVGAFGDIASLSE
jgi:hypothetical protein